MILHFIGEEIERWKGFLFFVLLYMCVMPECVSVPCQGCLVPIETRGRHQILWNIVLRWL